MTHKTARALVYWTLRLPRAPMSGLSATRLLRGGRSPDQRRGSMMAEEAVVPADPETMFITQELAQKALAKMLGYLPDSKEAEVLAELFFDACESIA